MVSCHKQPCIGSIYHWPFLVTSTCDKHYWKCARGALPSGRVLPSRCCRSPHLLTLPGGLDPPTRQEESSLLVASAAKFKNWFNVEVKENTEVKGMGAALEQAAAQDPAGFTGDLLARAPRHGIAQLPSPPAPCWNMPCRCPPQVVAIDRAARRITARAACGAETQHEYDALVLAPGANAIRPPLPGIDLPGIFQMKTVPDA